jgi:hypothetical protein
MDRYAKAVCIATIAGGLFRLLYVLVLHKPHDFDYSDMHGYIERAEHFADPTFHAGPYEWFYPSGTSTFLGIILKLFGKRFGFLIASILQGLASAAEIPLLFVATARFFSRRVAAIVAVLFAAHYLSVSYAGYFLSENYLEIGLIAACALLVPEKPLRCLWAGLSLGIGAWAKSQAFLLAPLWALVLIYQRRWAAAALLMAGTLAVVVPVSIFVSVQTGQPAFISSNGGQTFALAHCPIREISYNDPVGHTGAMFTVPVLNQRAERGEREASWGSAHYTEPFFHSGFYMHEGIECIKRYPRHALHMVFLHLIDSFAGPPWSNVMPWPDSHIATPFHISALISNLYISYLVLPLALIGLALRWRELGTWYLFVLPMASVLGSAVLFHGDPRFREPYDFCLFVGVALAVEVFWTRRHPLARPAHPTPLENRWLPPEPVSRPDIEP